MMSIVWMVVGLALLLGGAEALVRGSARGAKAVRLPSLVIGLTVVAFGTSAPELAVSVKAAIDGQAGLALGNVVGSNTFNVLFILGLSALIAPLIASRQLVRMDVPVMIGVSLLAWALAGDGRVGRIDGLMLCAGMIVYTVLLIVLGRRNTGEAKRNASAGASEPAAAPATQGVRGWLIVIGLTVGGLALLVLGARWLVEGAVGLARGMGVSDLMIGLTIVAAGTSMPEVATSVVASVRGERDIAIGNVVGSNIFNLLAVLGASAAISGDGVAVAEGALRLEIPVMTAVAAACLPIMITGGRISRWEGGLFLGYYAAYLAFLILSATGDMAADAMGRAMLWFVIPMTVLGLGMSVWAWVRRARPES